MSVSDQTQPVIAPKAKEVIPYCWDSDDTMSDGTMDESCDEDDDDDDMTRDERFRAMIQRQSKDRIITMMLSCPYEIKFDSGMTEWVRKQTKDTVLEFFFMNDEEKKAYYTVHGPMHDRKTAAEKAAAEKAAAAEKFRAVLQDESKDRIIMMMFLCPYESEFAYESEFDRVLTEWLWKQTKDTVLDFFFMNDQERNAYYTAHGPMHDSKVAVENDAAAEKAAAEKVAATKAAEKAAASEKFRAKLQNESKHRIIMMMFLCPYESKSDRVLTEWLWKQTKDTVIDFFFMNDQEKNAYYTAHGPMHDSDAPEYTDEHAMYAMERQHDDYYWRDREVSSGDGNQIFQS